MRLMSDIIFACLVWHIASSTDSFCIDFIMELLSELLDIQPQSEVGGVIVRIESEL